MKKILAILTVFLMAILLTSCVSDSTVLDKKIVWDDIVLGDILPEPPSLKGEIHTNAFDRLRVDINDLSSKQFNDYINACKENGFTVDFKFDSYSYTAYNSEGYKLSLYYFDSDKNMNIDLEAPIEMATITWPKSIAGQQAPAPKSTIGKFSFEYDDNFFVYVGNTSNTDYAEYVNTCSEKGFNVDYRKGDDYYYAYNSEGWHISICYEGNNIMSIDIDAPRENNDSNDTTTTSNSSSAQVTEPNSTKIESNQSVSNSNGLDPDFKAAMDSYEKFVDEYVAFMKKYNNNPSDIELLTDYYDFLNKYADFVEDFEKWEDEEMNAAETAYYIDVQARTSTKLLELAS